MSSHSPSTPAPASAAALRDLEALAREAHVSLDTVAQLYAREWAALAAQARMTTFLPILTTRKVRAILRQQCPPSRVPVAVRARALVQPTP
jgi:Protein of unknown function (DUF3562)